MNRIRNGVSVAAMVVLGAFLGSAGTAAGAAQTAAGTATASAATRQADAKELYSYTLTMDKIHKIVAIERELKSVPEDKAATQDNQNASSIGESAQRLAKYPQIKAVIKKQGFTPREYVVASMTFIQGTLAVGFKKQGAFKGYPPQITQQVNPANLTFLEQHWDELTKNMPELFGGPDAQ